MIDIHSHILPGLDDGARNLDESIQMAKLAVQEGIHTIYATPHHKNSSYENRKMDIVDRVEELNVALQSAGIGLTVLAGQENRIYGEILEDYEKGEILSLGDKGSYVLIEFPSGNVPRYAEQVLYELQFKGLTPIIVHPERNQEIVENPTILYNLVKSGSLSQVTAGSITGKFGKNIQKFSMQLIEHNLTHFIASDAHNIQSRAFHMSEAFETINKHYGMDLLDLFLENGEQVAANKSIYKEIPENIKKKKFFGLF